MANYATLKSTIEDNINQNGANAITGPVLQSALLAMVNSLGAGFQFADVATPDTDPGTPDQKVCYFAATPGTYANFGGIVLADGEVAIIRGSGTTWEKKTTGSATRGEFRPYASMGASAAGAYFLDRNMVFSSTLYEYVNSAAFDTAWVNVLPGTTKVSVAGATPYAFRFFSSNETLNASTNLGSNTTGVIPLGAKLVLIAFRHVDNPSGYNALEIEQDSWFCMVDKFFPRGLYLASNHVLNISGASIKFQSNANFDCFVVFTQGATKINISGLLSTANYRFFNSAEIFDGSEIASKLVGTNTTGDVPVGAVVCVVSMRKTDYPGGHDSSVLERVYGVQKKTIRILLIGNSATDDALSYVPFIMQNMGVPVNFQIGIAMMSSSTLAMHLDNWENETAAYQFRLYNGGAAWQDFADKTLQWMFDNYTWDIVSLQQAQPQNAGTYQPYLNKLINGISGYVRHAIKFIWYQTHIYAAQTNGGAPRSDETIRQYYENEVAACQNVVGATACEYIVPVSTAIENARSVPAIKALGDYANNENNPTGNGYLNYLDGVHLQEGLPCQIAAYTFVLAFLELYAFREFSINGETTRVTSAWTSGKNIPSPHGSPIGSTDANCLIAQKCAIMAMKRPFEITDMNGIVNPE